MDIKTYEIIKAYNEWVLNQKGHYRQGNEDCPYFLISEKTIKEFTPEHKKKFEKIKELPLEIKLIGETLWKEILATGYYGFPEKWKIPKRIEFRLRKLSERIESNPFLITPIYEKDTFLSLCRNKGLNVPFFHFDWYEKNELIEPLLKEKEKNYYNIFQIYILDVIQDYRERSLKYPNSTYCNPVLWQDYLLWSKEDIKKEVSRWNEVVKILLDIKDLYSIFFDETWKEISRRKKKGLIRKFLFRDFLNELQNREGCYYAQKIQKAHPQITDSMIRYWRTNCLPAWVIKHNPVIQIVNKLPILSRIFKESEPEFSTIFRKINEIKLANFYVDIIGYLNFYLKCLLGEETPTAEELFSRELPEKAKICLICGEKFLPNPKRAGGKSQLLCGKKECEKEYRKRQAIQYRKRKKLLNR